MRRTEMLQEIRNMRFEEAYEGCKAERLTQEQASRLLGAPSGHPRRRKKDAAYKNPRAYVREFASKNAIGSNFRRASRNLLLGLFSPVSQRASVLSSTPIFFAISLCESPKWYRLYAVSFSSDERAGIAGQYPRNSMIFGQYFTSGSVLFAYQWPMVSLLRPIRQATSFWKSRSSFRFARICSPCVLSSTKEEVLYFEAVSARWQKGNAGMRVPRPLVTRLSLHFSEQKRVSQYTCSESRSRTIVSDV